MGIILRQWAPPEALMAARGWDFDVAYQLFADASAFLPRIQDVNTGEVLVAWPGHYANSNLNESFADILTTRRDPRMKNTHELTTAGAFARKHDLSLSDMIKLRDQNQLPDGIFLGGRVWFKRSDCARWAEQFSLHGIRTKAMMASGADPRT